MIDLDLPDWVDPKKELFLISGKELVAFKRYGQPWSVKVERCNQCGECCLDFPPVVFGYDEEGKCNKLEREDGRWLCRAGSDTPKRCLADPFNIEELGCSIRYR